MSTIYVLYALLYPLSIDLSYPILSYPSYPRVRSILFYYVCTSYLILSRTMSSARRVHMHGGWAAGGCPAADSLRPWSLPWDPCPGPSLEARPRTSLCTAQPWRQRPTPFIASLRLSPFALTTTTTTTTHHSPLTTPSTHSNHSHTGGSSLSSHHRNRLGRSSQPHTLLLYSPTLLPILLPTLLPSPTLLPTYSTRVSLPDHAKTP